VRLPEPSSADAGQDFGRAFYTTTDPADAAAYGRARPLQARRRPRPDVVEARLPLAELGAVVDVRPGGAHRALWEAFLSRPLPMMDRIDPTLAPLSADAFRAAAGSPGAGRPTHWLNLAKSPASRGMAFDAFLAHHRLSPDVVVGDLGGLGTTGTGTGMQVALRSERAIARLNRALGVPAGGESPPPPPRSAAAPPPKPRPPAHPRLPPDPDLDPGLDRAFPSTTPAERRASEALAAQHRARRAADPDARLPGEVPTPGVGDATEMARVRAAIAARMRPEDARRFDELLLLGGEAMQRVVLAETDTGRSRRRLELLRRLREPLGARLGQDEIARLRPLVRERLGAGTPPLSAAEADARLDGWLARGMSIRDLAEVSRLDNRLYYERGRRFGYGTDRRARMREQAEAAQGTPSEMLGTRRVRSRAVLEAALAHPTPSTCASSPPPPARPAAAATGT
jgi:hypothetical protein